MKKPLVSDWKVISERNGKPIEYSESIQRYWFRGELFDEGSARHHGLVGAGAVLFEAVARHNAGVAT